VVLEIRCDGVSFGVLRIAVDVARLLACHVSGLWSTTTVTVMVVVAVGVVDGGGVGVLVVGGGGWLSCMVVVGRGRLALLVTPNRASGFADVLSGKAVSRLVCVA
jgi:hypothetical protein